MQLYSSNSAVYRCPTEVWGIILGYASFQPILYETSNSFSPCTLLDDEVEGPLHANWIEQQSAVVTVRRIRLVCREWRELSESSFLNRIVVRQEGSATFWAAQLHETVRGSLKGASVRSLELISDKSGVAGDEEAVLRILQACTRLEELQLHTTQGDVGRFTETLIASCSASLEVLLIGCWKHSQLQLAHYIHILEGCPRLRSLGCATENHVFDAPTSVIPQYRLKGPSALKDLTWRLSDETTAPLLNVLANSDLPSLREVDIMYYFDCLQLADSPLGPVPPGMSSFFQSHGTQLLSVDMDPGHFPSEDGLAFAILELCPNLHDFFFDLAGCHPQAVPRPHSNLRRLECRSFFESVNDPQYVAEHVEKVLPIIQAFCQPGFPRLAVIRGFDIEPSTPGTVKLQNQYGDFPEHYRVLMGKVANRCAVRNIRFEDCLGELVKLDFMPGAEWWYAMTHAPSGSTDGGSTDGGSTDGEQGGE